uniref:Pentatricopeptide repeat-containing protein n=1 Tax=Quercus lobata TaxID=97700 RepID=A0A7N2RB25_QUELO
MLRAEVMPTSYTFSPLIKACASLSALGFGEAVHCHIWRNGFDSCVFVQTALIDFYSNFGKIGRSRRVFDEMPDRDVYAWTTIVSAYVRTGDLSSASGLFEEMPERNTATWNTMIDGYARMGNFDSTELLFNQMSVRDIISWTTMITCNSQHQKFREALAIFNEMTSNGIHPNEVTMATVISACAHLGALDLGKEIHLHKLQNGFDVDVYIGSALIDIYAKCGSLDRSLSVFFKLREKNLFCWNSVIDGLAVHGKEAPSVSFFFARLGVFLESSGGRHPQVGLFVPQNCGAFRPILIGLYPLLRHSLIAHHLKMTAIEYRDSDIRSNELETGLSSSSESSDKDSEIVMPKPSSSSKPSFSSKIPSSSIPFHALSESCLLETRHLKSIYKRVQLPEGLLFALNVAPRQLISNAWRTIIGCMSIWVSVHDGDMITLNEFLYLYRLKPSTHYGYFQLLPWNRESRIVSSFPTYFHDWKSRCFFISGSGWETMFDDLWVANRPLLKEHYQGRIKAALEFALTIDNFNEMVNPCRLYECCLGPKPSTYILKEISREENKMAIRYNKDKYARFRNLKNEPLSLITPRSKKRKLDEGKDETPALQSLFCTPSSPTPSLKMMNFSPLTTHSKWKAKSTKAKEKVKELKEALKIEKKLVIQKDEEVQAALQRTNEEHEKVIAKFLESDHFSDMQFEQYFKGFELLRHWMMKHYSHVADFANPDFEAIDIEILADEVNEKEGETIVEATKVVGGEGAAIRGANDEAQTETDRVEEIVNVP